MRRDAPATQRNREPLLEVLTPLLPGQQRVLEIASGTGQHARFFAEKLDVLWQPSDMDPDAVASIDAWADGHPRIAPASLLDVHTQDWPTGPFDAVFAANMIHISPWSATKALLQGAGNVLKSGGFLILYGPFKRGGQHTSPSNVDFEKWLHSLSPDFGVRDLDAVLAQAVLHGMQQKQVTPMPANNFTVVLEKA